MSSAPTNGYSNWGNYCYPIPLAAQTPTTQFRWNQTNTSGNVYDQWGVDNVNIATCTGYSSLWSGGNIPFGYSLDTITVSPYDTTTYNLIYSNWIDDTCTASLFIGIEQPSIISSTIASICTGSDTLDAQATIKANCNYSIKLMNYLPPGVLFPTGATQLGWTNGQLPPNNFHYVDLDINNSFYSSYTMVSGGQSSNETYQIPVTDGDDLIFEFNALGNTANECSYQVFDNQNNLLFSTGLPGSSPQQFFNTPVSCPATATYNYSWQNLTNGGVAGLNDPNIQNPLATVAVPTDFEVTAYDSLNPQCIAIDTVTVLPNANPISTTLSGNTLICTPNPVYLIFDYYVEIYVVNLELHHVQAHHRI